MEDIAQKFYDGVIDVANNAGVELTKFYSTLFDVEFDKKNISIFNKLVKLYGRKLVFLAIMDMYDMDNFNNKDNFYSLASYFCKKRFESRKQDGIFSDLSKDIEKRKKELSGKKFGKGADLLDATGDSK